MGRRIKSDAIITITDSAFTSVVSAPQIKAPRHEVTCASIKQMFRALGFNPQEGDRFWITIDRSVLLKLQKRKRKERK